jgi:small subunit ribosomal protein S13
LGLHPAKIEIADNPEAKVIDLTTEQTASGSNFRRFRLKLEGDLRRLNGLNIKRLNEINCHREKRHRTIYQFVKRTRTNARSKRGSKRLLLVRKIKLK